jgi:hypothetical protein
MADTKISNMTASSASELSGALDYLAFPLVRDNGGNFANLKLSGREMRTLLAPTGSPFLMVNVLAFNAMTWAGDLYSNWATGSGPVLASSEASWHAEIPDDIGPHIQLEAFGKWRITLTSHLRFNDGTSSTAEPTPMPNGVFEYGWQITNSNGGTDLRTYPANARNSRHTRSGDGSTIGTDRGRRITWTDIFYLDYDVSDTESYARVQPSFFLELETGTTPFGGSFPWIDTVMTAERVTSDI